MFLFVEAPANPKTFCRVKSMGTIKSITFTMGTMLLEIRLISINWLIVYSLVGTLCLDNPQKLTRHALEKIAQGMRSRPITNVEPKDEVPDNLHFKINLSENLFTIQKRIVAIENDVHKQPKYENVAENKQKKSSNRSKTNEIIPK